MTELSKSWEELKKYGVTPRMKELEELMKKLKVI